MKKNLQFLFAIGLMFGSMVVSAQVTTSSINGRILDGENETLLGATIVAKHTPTGTNYGTTTDIEGYYRIANMRIGGPYVITITYVGKREKRYDGVFLQLGASEKLDAVLVDEQNALDAIVIDATRDNVFDSGTTGTSTNISQRDLNNMPSATRGLGDFLRKTPQAQVSEGGAISLGGQNNRYNSIFLDGAVNNDVFGLAGSGTNGGQIGINPISIDAIESLQVNLAPFDVRQSGFTGGSINAITRSGSNNTEGSAYAYIRDQSLAGKTPVGINADNRQRLDDFSTQLIGARVGGAILKNKLFYFVNYENQDDSTPRPFDPSLYTGDSSIADIDALRQNLINSFGYDPGDYRNNTNKLTSDKLTIRLDYNLDDKNSITLKNNYVSGKSSSPGSSSTRTISFENNGISFPSETNSTTLEWRTTNGSNLSNNLIIGYSTVSDDRDQLGDPFPNVRIDDGNNGSIFLGSESFSTANLLEQKIFTVTNNFEVQAGAHNFTFGANFEHYDMNNVFVRQNFGAYRFRSLADFNTYFDNDPSNDAAPRDYDYSYSLLDPAGTTGDDISAAAAQFKYAQLGLYVQDEWSVTDNFRLTYGLRFDMPYWENGTVNEDFNTRTIALLEAAGKDLEGARVGQRVKSNVHFSPRVGFNWDVFSDKTTQIRGGTGIFTSRIPLVWPGGAYNNNGISVGSVDERDIPGGAGAARFVADPFNQPIGNGAAPGSGELGGQIDIFSPDFKLPQVLKTNLGIDQKLGVWGLIASVDFLYNETINNVLYQNLNIAGPVGTLNGADNRPYYSRNAIDNTYERIILATNTSEGYSYNGTFTLTKPFDRGFSGQVSYTYGDGRSIFEGTSSQNSSQWRGIQTVNGKNGPLETQPSAFAVGHRATANLSYEYAWNDNIKTTLGLFVNGQQGGTISYLYNNRSRNLLNDDSSDNALMYIPRNQSEITLVPLTTGGVTFTPAEQWAALDAFITSREYLDERRGKYAEANGDRGPWNTLVDLKVLQDFSLDFGGPKKHTFQVSLDMFNFLNFVNKNWGEQVRIGGNATPLTTVSGGPNPTFTYDPNFATNFEFIDDAGVQSSRWQAQIGLRYIFN
jgi:outer membrane receptor protein involved in Fe transport